MRTTPLFICLAVLALAMTGCQSTGPCPYGGKPKKRAATGDCPGRTVVFNMTAGEEDLHKAWMGLALIQHALDDGREVVGFFNVHAPALVARDNLDSYSFDEHGPLPQVVAGLIEQGATVLVCPACAKKAGIMDQSQLLDGAEFATRAKLFDRIGRDTVVFSY